MTTQIVGRQPFGDLVHHRRMAGGPVNKDRDLLGLAIGDRINPVGERRAVARLKTRQFRHARPIDRHGAGADQFPAAAGARWGRREAGRRLRPRRPKMARSPSKDWEIRFRTNIVRALGLTNSVGQSTLQRTQSPEGREACVKATGAGAQFECGSVEEFFSRPRSAPAQLRRRRECRAPARRNPRHRPARHREACDRPAARPRPRRRCADGR